MVYITVLSVLDNIGWYITRFCQPLPWTMLMLCHLVLSILDNIGWLFHGCVWLRQYWLVYQQVLSVMDSNGWYISLFCLSRTIYVGISPCVVYHEQKWLVYHPVLSVTDKNSWYISYFFLSWTKLVGTSTGFVCRGQ